MSTISSETEFLKRNLSELGYQKEVKNGIVEFLLEQFHIYIEGDVKKKKDDNSIKIEKCHKISPTSQRTYGKTNPSSQSETTALEYPTSSRTSPSSHSTNPNPNCNEDLYEKYMKQWVQVMVEKNDLDRIQVMVTRQGEFCRLPTPSCITQCLQRLRSRNNKFLYRSVFSDLSKTIEREVNPIRWFRMNYEHLLHAFGLYQSKPLYNDSDNSSHLTDESRDYGGLDVIFP